MKEDPFIDEPFDQDIHTDGLYVPGKSKLVNIDKLIANLRQSRPELFPKGVNEINKGSSRKTQG